MAFNNSASKLERAVRAFLVLQGKCAWADCVTMNGTSAKAFPNRVVGSLSFSPTRNYRPEGTIRVQVDHRFSVEVLDDESQRVALDAMVGDTQDTLGFGSGKDTSGVAAGITTAGRWLAANDGDGERAPKAVDNADMANFRCDDFVLDSPLHTRGKPDGDNVAWIESLHYVATVSTATN